MRATFNYSELRRVMNGMDITVGSLRQLGASHSIVVLREDRSMRVPRWKEWATVFEDIEHMHVSHRSLGPSKIVLARVVPP